jgi:hypothetical protein
MSNHASQCWLQRVAVALGDDALRRPFIDESVQLVRAERDAAEKTLRQIAALEPESHDLQVNEDERLRWIGRHAARIAGLWEQGR